MDEALQNLSGKELSGETAFVLHDTYGFPIEITKEICEERGYTVNEQEFGVCMDKQRDRARAANAKDAEAAWSTFGGIYADLLKEVGVTAFSGYDKLVDECKVVALIQDGKRVSQLASGTTGEVVLVHTPFYAEMGGEVGDPG